MTKNWQRLIFPLLITLPVQAGDWQPRQLPWGAPDLQGTWTSGTLTPLERPAELSDLVLSDTEANMIEQAAAGQVAAIDNVPEGDLAAGDIEGAYNAAWMDPGTKLARINGEAHSSIIVEPQDGKVPYTRLARQRLSKRYLQYLKHHNPEEQLLGDRCVVGFGSTGGPPMLPVLYNNNYQIVQSQGYVLIMVEMNHAIRTIPIDSRPLPESITPWLGDSVGHWEENTLVVTTRRSHPQQSARFAIRHRLYLDTNSTVIERFTRTAENEIHYEFTVSNPELYTQDWRGELPLYSTDGQIYEYACHEGNYALPNILAGARKEEQE